MRTLLLILLGATLGACAQIPMRPVETHSACTDNEASYECQVERYRNVNE